MGDATLDSIVSIGFYRGGSELLVIKIHCTQHEVQKVWHHFLGITDLGVSSTAKYGMHSCLIEE